MSDTGKTISLIKALAADKAGTSSALSSKLDAPGTPGTATQVLVSDGNGGQAWGSIAAGEVVIDSTLSVSGAAADAAAAGEVKNAVKYETVVPTLRNGSIGNASNANAVAMTSSVPTHGVKAITLHANVALQDGYYYYWVLRKFNSSNTLIAEIDPIATTKDCNAEIYVGDAASIQACLFMLNSSNFYALRIANVGNCINLIYHYEKPYENKEIGIVFRNGTQNNPNETNHVCTTNIIAKNEASKVVIHNRNSLSTGEKFLYLFYTYSVSSGVAYSNSSNKIREFSIYSDKTDFEIELNQNEKGFAVAIKKDLSGTAVALRIRAFDVMAFGVTRFYDNFIKNTTDFIFKNALAWRNGTAYNTGNSYCITPTDIIPVNGASKIIVNAKTIPLASGEKYRFVFNSLSVSSGTPQSAVQGKRIRESLLTVSTDGIAVFDILPGEIGVSVSIEKLNASDQEVALRIESTDVSGITFVREYSANNYELRNKLDNARHIGGSQTVKPLTLLHFSDIHADYAAMNRIIGDAQKVSGMIDDMICTGDMNANASGQISSWWNANVLTCIGNHDTASYSDGTYNWTALSMENRDSYYIAPFESGWGITHTSGKSYYYKDYSSSKVRLIVMDAMLYNDNGSDATDQTTWLSGLLGSAITNNLHVLIAIHAPHGGATAKECSFSRYGATTMPTNVDCNTPQAVIDAVATAIAGGLKFIGYLVGHTHQDNIWDAENDGTQLMYCITCGNTVTESQWINSDQHRGITEDAYNLVTIDTVNKRVKIIRGGGADIDHLMRNRKQISFSYADGSIIGQGT